MKHKILKTSQQKQVCQTQFFYGKEVQKKIGTLLRPCASSVLVLFGAEVLRTTYWYRQLLSSLQAARIFFIEFGNIENGAALTQIEEGIALCKRHQVDYILAVGGGSVIDSAKAIAMGAVCDHCVWNYFTTKREPNAALPVAVMLTLPGSGSENNGQTMIINEDTLLKLHCCSDVLQSQFCLVNTEVFYTISQSQLSHAIVTMLTRLLCDYLLQLHQNADQKLIGQLEQKIKSLMHKVRRLRFNRFDDQAWLELVLLDCYQGNAGVDGQQENVCMYMAAELSAMHGIPHGAVLAVLLPAWVRFVCGKNPAQYSAFARHVMGVAARLKPQEQLQESIRQLELFMIELGLTNTLCDLGIEAFCLKNAAQLCTGYGWGKEQPFGAIQPLFWQDL